MKGSKTVEEKEDSDSDGFDIEEWRKSKARTQELASEQLQKKGSKDMDGKKTTKLREDPVMNNLYQKILRESDKFQDPPEEAAKERKDLYEYNPHIICGKLTNIHRCDQEEKEVYSLGDENQCHAMDLTEDIIVVIVGKVGYKPIQGINANLYIPKEFYEYIGKKSANLACPQRLVKLEGNRHAIWIKRQQTSNSSTNILNYPYLVLDPQNLLYPSYICSWIDCKRSIALKYYIQGQKDVNQAIVYGSTCHRLLEWLAEKVVTVEEYRKDRDGVLGKLYQSMLYDMFLINRTLLQFEQTCTMRLDNLVKFYERHILKGEELEVDKYKRIYLKIEKLISSEYMFRSNFFGLKGKVDLLLSGELIDKKMGKSQQVYIPMELKTGKKVSDTHKRQTEIYNILVRQKYKKNVVGLLYYSDSDIKYFRHEDPLSAFEIIMVHRNQIAQNLVQLYQSGNIWLPHMAVAFSQCNFCQSSAICELSALEIEDTKDFDKDQVPSRFHKSIEPIERKYGLNERDYITRWFKMIHLQELQFKQLNTDYWKMGISNFILVPQELPNISSKVKDTKVRLQLIHHCKSQEQLIIFQDFYKSAMKVRMVMNTLNMIECCKIVSTNSDLATKHFRMLIEMNNLEIEYSPSKLAFFIEQEQSIDLEIETFQNTFFSVMRNTVVSLIQSQSGLKNILLNDGEEKEVIEIDSEDEEIIPVQSVTEEECDGFNNDQRKAFKKSILQRRFCLIEGMPGTGKTELIIRLINKFSKMNKTILVTTFTNRALDNILQRLIDSGRVEKDLIIREGNQYSCSKTLKEYTSQGIKFDNIAIYKKFYTSKTIWFVTLSSLFIQHLPKEFDVAILDQASQCLQPTCVQGLLRAKKFILIGDYKQLQPVIKSKQAHRKGMCVSLFQRLCKQYPENTVSLKKQYRMNHTIMTLSNRLVYNGELELATESIKHKLIKLPSDWEKQVPKSFTDIISPANSIVFINYDPIIDSITRKYKEKETMIRKIIQAQLSAFIFRTFAQLKVPLSTMSVIAAMNTSVNKIIDLLKQSKVIFDNHGTVLTIDKSQGIDKDVIILLIQRGNQDLIENPRRLNVALTRAKSKLIIVGSEQHLSKMKVWDGTLGKMLKEYQVQLSKAMIEDMITQLDCFVKKTKK